MQNGDDGLPSIILDGRGLLVKMLIILNPHGIVKSNFAKLINFNIIETQVYF